MYIALQNQRDGFAINLNYFIIMYKTKWNTTTIRMIISIPVLVLESVNLTSFYIRSGQCLRHNKTLNTYKTFYVLIFWVLILSVATLSCFVYSYSTTSVDKYKLSLFLFPRCLPSHQLFVITNPYFHSLGLKIKRSDKHSLGPN